MIAVIAVIAGGLGSSAGVAPAGAASSNRACDLLTAKQVKKAVGASVGAPVASKSGGHAVCDWKTTGSGDRVMLSVAILPLSGPEQAKFDQLAEEDANRTYDDLGDGAVLECTIPRRGECLAWGRLWVVVADEYLGLSLSGTDPDTEAAALEKLGRQAAKEL